MKRILVVMTILALVIISCDGRDPENDVDDLAGQDDDIIDEAADDDYLTDELADAVSDGEDQDDEGDEENDTIPDDDTIFPDRIHVYINATGKNDGTSWKNAYTDLQDAIDAAQAYMEIWVAKGTYKPSRIVNSMTPIPSPEDEDYGRFNHFALKSSVEVLGGFAGTETNIAQRNWTENKTVLSGDLDGSGDLSNGDAYHVVLNVNIEDTAVLDGFTITGGNANSSYQSVTDVHMWHGGGMNNRNFASPTIKNCIFEGNSALVNGGGMANLSSSPQIRDSFFNDNTAARGGGIANSSSSPRVENTVFKNNSTIEGYGGAVINAEKSRGTFSECTFENNVSQDAGAIANNVNSNVVIEKCVFKSNSAENNGGAITNAGSSPVIRNCVFDSNDAIAAGGGAIENHDSSSPKIVYSIFKNNTASGELADGGAILTNSGKPLIISSIFHGNSAYNGGAVANRETEIMVISSTFYGNSAIGEFGYGGAIYNESDAVPEIINSILWDNSSNFEGPEIYNQFATPKISFSSIQGAFPGGIWDEDLGEDYGDNISADPNFTGPDIADFSLEPASPCIDNGSNAPFETGGAAASFLQDYNGNLRIYNEITDIGAIEFVQ